MKPFIGFQALGNHFVYHKKASTSETLHRFSVLRILWKVFARPILEIMIYLYLNLYQLKYRKQDLHFYIKDIEILIYLYLNLYRLRYTKQDLDVYIIDTKINLLLHLNFYQLRYWKQNLDFYIIDIEIMILLYLSLYRVRCTDENLDFYIRETEIMYIYISIYIDQDIQKRLRFLYQRYRNNDISIS